jgi:hypothetical protein
MKLTDLVGPRAVLVRNAEVMLQLVTFTLCLARIESAIGERKERVHTVCLKIFLLQTQSPAQPLGHIQTSLKPTHSLNYNFPAVRAENELCPAGWARVLVTFPVRYDVTGILFCPTRSRHVRSTLTEWWGAGLRLCLLRFSTAILLRLHTCTYLTRQASLPRPH